METRQTGGQFKLKEHESDPFTDLTVILFKLTQASNVRIQSYNLQGQKVAEVAGRAAKGDHEIVLKIAELGIPSATYAYLEVQNSDGVLPGDDDSVLINDE